MLLLDEPTNHLDAESVAWLEHHLHEFPGTIVAVTHDRYFLDNVAGWILELDRGAGHPLAGQLLVLARAEEEAPRGRGEGRVGAPAHAGPRARVGARVAARAAGQVEGPPRRLRGACWRRSRRSARRRSRSASRPARGWASVVDQGREAARRPTATTLLIDDLSFNLPRGGIVGIIGANGAGKTTLFRMITGQEKPDGGTLRIGDTVKLAYVDQSRDTLDGDKTAFDEIAQGAEFLEIGKRKIPTRAYVAGFGFKGTDQQKRVKDLSGGERNRGQPGQAAAQRAATSCCSTSRPTTSTSTPCARWRTGCSPSPAAWWSSATIAGSSTASPPTSSPSRATARWSGSRATTRTTRPIGGGAWAPTPTSRTGSATRSSFIDTIPRAARSR